jgi:bifunctional non-homologous end joining protein LigD
MSINEYRKKRKFKKTPEPTTHKMVSGKLAFSVQRHDATHLHYDFRLECKGVLLSWAVPKGLPLSSKEKRLAIRVEDHPIDYQSFEGVIPEGN